MPGPRGPSSKFHFTAIRRRGGESELQLQRELNHAPRFACLHDRLRAGRRHRGAAALTEDRRAETRRARRSVDGRIEIRMVQRIEEFRAELQVRALAEVEALVDP